MLLHCTYSETGIVMLLQGSAWNGRSGGQISPEQDHRIYIYIPECVYIAKVVVTRHNMSECL